MILIALVFAAVAFVLSASAGLGGSLVLLEWVDWFNNRRLFGPIGDIPPAEFEAMYDQQQGAPATGAALN